MHAVLVDCTVLVHLKTTATKPHTCTTTFALTHTAKRQLSIFKSSTLLLLLRVGLAHAHDNKDVSRIYVLFLWSVKKQLCVT